MGTLREAEIKLYKNYYKKLKNGDQKLTCFRGLI